MPYTFNEAVWIEKAADETKELDSFFERCQVTVIELTLAAFSGTLDIQGKVSELNAYANVPYIRQDQATIQTPSVSQIVPSVDTGVYRYVVLGYWRRLQIVMTRSAGTITCGVAGSSSALAFPYLPTKLIANSGVDIGDVDLGGTKETAVTQETGAVGAIGWLSSIKGFLANLKTYIGATDAAVVAVNATGSVTAKLRRVTQGLEDLKTLIVLATGSNIIGRVGHSITGIGNGVATVTTPLTDVAIATSTPAKGVIVQAQTDNTGAIAVGAEGIVATIATGTGIILYAGDSVYIPCDNLIDIWIDAIVGGEGVRFTYFT